MSTPVISPYQPAWAPALWAVFHAAVHELTAGQYSAAQRAAWAPDTVDAARWSARMAALQPAVAWVDGAVAGYADLQPDGLIDHFFVAPAHARQGVGRQLMTHVVHTAQQRGLARLYADVSLTAQPFFSASGFVVERHGGPVLRGVWLQNARMVRHLASAQSG